MAEISRMNSLSTSNKINMVAGVPETTPLGREIGCVRTEVNRTV